MQNTVAFRIQKKQQLSNAGDEMNSLALQTSDDARQQSEVVVFIFQFVLCSNSLFLFLICSFSSSLLLWMQKPKCNKVSSIVNVTITTKMQQNAWLRWCFNCLLAVQFAETDRTIMAHEQTAIGRCVAALWCQELSYCHPNGIWSSKPAFFLSLVCLFTLGCFVKESSRFLVSIKLRFAPRLHKPISVRFDYNTPLWLRTLPFRLLVFVFVCLLRKHNKISWIPFKSVNIIGTTSKTFFIDFINISICGLPFHWIWTCFRLYST